MLNEFNFQDFVFNENDLKSFINTLDKEDAHHSSKKTTPESKTISKTPSKDSPSNLRPNSTIIIEDEETIPTLKRKIRSKRKQNELENLELSETIENIIKNYEEENKENNNSSQDTFSLLKKKRHLTRSRTKKNSISSQNSAEKENSSTLHKKKLKKVTDNKELKISLDTTCSICLEEIKDLANPNNCNHDFCRECLIKWSKNCSNTCPLCKKPFHKIFIYENNKRIEIPVERKKLKVNQEYEEGPSEVCYECGKRNNHRKMIVCSMCKYYVCHYYCDRLKEEPRDKWYCKYCKQVIREERAMRKKIGRLYVN